MPSSMRTMKQHLSALVLSSRPPHVGVVAHGLLASKATILTHPIRNGTFVLDAVNFARGYVANLDLNPDSADSIRPEHAHG